MGAHKKQRIFSILAILTMAVILTCIFTACGDTGAQNATYKVTIHPNNGQADIVWDAKSDIPLITREGYHIVGYYLDGGLSISTSLESLKSTELTKNLDVYVKWEQDACQHKEVVDAAVAPTCTTTGLTEGKHCSVCRAILQVQTVVPALGHALVHHEAQDSTCTEVGWEEYDTCSRCDYTTYVEIKKKNHTESDWITDIEPTCTVDGTKRIECTECHTVLQTGTIAATGHNESDWITDKAATCTEDGTKHTECTKCHTVFQTGTISATGHSYGDWIIDVASTCEKAGSMHKECEHCGATENATIKALGHNLVHHDAKDATCTEIGWEAYDTCSRCDYSTYEEIAASGHKESDWITDSEATCTKNGSKHTVCTVCNTIIHTEVLPATGHSYSDAWTHDETYHWHDATCGHDVMSDKAKHTYDEEWNCTVCGYHDDSLHGTEICANTLAFDSENNVISGKVSNNTATFSFINEIVVAKGAMYTVSTDINGSNVIRTKTVSLEIGDNTYYILVENGGDLALYTVTLRRRPIHTVAFDTKGGTEVQSQQVEEDDFATEPTTERLGYTFDKWDWDFDNAITDNITVTASWNIVIYNIVYDFNIPNDSVSQDVDNSMNATTYTVEDEIVFAAPIRKGYTFAGWTVEQISKGTIDTVTTTAKWTVINYDIVYDFGDATSVSKANNNEANPATYTIEDDVIFMVPTRVGYTFVSWDKNITKGMIDTQTITASWNIITYDIVYNLNVPAESVSQDVDNSMNVATYTVEDEIVFAAPIRKGYTFAGWTVEQISKGTIDTVTTTAKWTVINYDIVYDFGDATSASKANNNEANPATYTIEDEIVFKEPARNYYTFVEWNKTNISKGTTEQQTVVATWDAETHTITYVLNGWTNVSDNKASYTIEDQTFALFDGISGESLFCGWYLDEEYTNCIQSIDASTMKDYVVYAMPDCGATNGLVIQNGVVKSYSGASTDVVIPLYYKGKSVASVDQSAFRNCTKLTSVIIPNSVKNISSGAFKGCSSLESITIPFVGAKAGLTSSSTYQYPFGYIFGTSSYTGGVATEQYYYGSSTSSTTSATYYIPSSLKSVTVTGGSILYGAFYNFTGLTSVTIPDSVTSIGSNAFRGCTGLNSVTIGSGVTSIGYVAFSGCTGLTSVTIGKSVTSIGQYAFSGCTGLTSVYYTEDVAGWCGISGLGNLMEYGSSSKTLYIGGNKVEGELTIPDSVTTIPSSAFRGCTGLTTINWNATACTSAGFWSSPIFSGCTNLTTVNIGENVTIIPKYAFYGCTGLTVVNWNATACTDAGSYDYPTFKGCKNLATVKIGENVTTIPSYAFNGCTGLTSITIPDSVMSIGWGAFYGCTGLTSVTIPNSVTSIGNAAFSGCTGLTSIRIPDSVTSIGNYAFRGCTGLTSITIGNGIESISRELLSGCSSLESITIPFVGARAGLTSSSTYQYPLGYIFGTDSYTGGVATTQYYYGDSTSSITSATYYIPSLLKSVTVTGGNILYGAFYNCNGLTSVTIGSGVTSICDYAFYRCTGLTSIYYAGDVAGWCGISGLEYLMSSSRTLHIGGNKVEGELIISDSVTSIPSYAFYGCTGLTSVTIPNSVTSIGGSAFIGCTGLTSVFYAGTAEQWAAISIGSNNGYLTRATRIYNYDGVEKTYSFVTNCDESVDPVTAIYLSTLPTVTKEGHHFCGWYDNAEFAGNAIAAPYCSKDKTTLYAKWLTEEEWLASLDGTSFEMAFIAESGKTYDVNITKGGQIVYFAFTPTASGSFTIQSTGSGDTYGTLYSASHSSLTTNDDDGDGNNFKITYTMTAGTTYYVAVKFYNSSTTGTFKVQFS